jgi:hypothetical protein
MNLPEIDVMQWLLECAREDHQSHHGSVFIFDTNKACCKRGQAIIDAEAILNTSRDNYLLPDNLVGGPA